MTDAHQQRILEGIATRYDQRVIANVRRSDYVESMVAVALGSGWQWEGDWELWDLACRSDGVRVEVKQSAAMQTWSLPDETPKPSFDIAPRQGDEKPKRHADIYVFAWHPLREESADHRCVEQWEFYVVAEKDLPANQKTIRLGPLTRLKGARKATFTNLSRVISTTTKGLLSRKGGAESPT